MRPQEEPSDVLILAQSSIELLPKNLRTGASAKRVESLFGVRPEMQILDRNFHGKAMDNLKEPEKRGRPDIVHFALIDATSTPLFSHSKIKVVVHTIDDVAIILRAKTRPPRTLQRFCGVMAKLLSGEGEEERKLFQVFREVSFSRLQSFLNIERTVSLTKLGTRKDLYDLVRFGEDSKTAYVVGGFARGHFEKEIITSSSDAVSISDESLAAHVVTARLCYDLEKVNGI